MLVTYIRATVDKRHSNELTLDAMGWFTRLVGKAAGSELGKRVIGRAASLGKKVIGKAETVYSHLKGVPHVKDAIQYAEDNLSLAKDGKSAWHAAKEILNSAEDYGNNKLGGDPRVIFRR